MQASHRFVSPSRSCSASPSSRSTTTSLASSPAPAQHLPPHLRQAPLHRAHRGLSARPPTTFFPFSASLFSAKSSPAWPPAVDPLHLPAYLFWAARLAMIWPSLPAVDLIFRRRLLPGRPTPASTSTYLTIYRLARPLELPAIYARAFFAQPAKPSSPCFTNHHHHLSIPHVLGFHQRFKSSSPRLGLQPGHTHADQYPGRPAPPPQLVPGTDSGPDRSEIARSAAASLVSSSASPASSASSAGPRPTAAASSPSPWGSRLSPAPRRRNPPPHRLKGRIGTRKLLARR